MEKNTETTWTLALMEKKLDHRDLILMENKEPVW
jgi:hypothetical protein